MIFTLEQISFMDGRGIDHNNLDAVFDTIEPMLGKEGFDHNYQPTKVGLMCESILDTLVDMGY